MTQTRRFAIALLAVGMLVLPARAQDTPTPTHTHTPTQTPTNTPTTTPTPTINTSILQRGKKLTRARLTTLTSTSPAAKQGDMSEILQLGVRQIRHRATNAIALGLGDVGVVTSILAFTTSTGAGASQTLLIEGTDYTVAAGDIVPIGDHSAETWLITYRPYP